MGRLLLVGTAPFLCVDDSAGVRLELGAHYLRLPSFAVLCVCVAAGECERSDQVDDEIDVDSFAWPSGSGGRQKIKWMLNESCELLD